MRPDEAGDYIAGYTVGNDYGLHDFRDTDAGSMLRVKGSDTLAPVGPGLVTDWDFRGKTIRTIVNGEVKQDDSTANMEWDMHYLVADLARTITLVPGDLIFSGTPANSRPVQPGDVVEVEVEGLGRLTNHIVEGPTPIRTDVGAQPTESEEVVSTALGGDWEFRGIRTPSKDLYPSRSRGREPHRMIKVDVDMNKCQHYGQCVFEAPEVFQLNDDDKLEHLAEAETRARRPRGRGRRLPHAGDPHRQ